MTTNTLADSSKLILKPHSGWQPVNWREIWRGRELFTFLVWRDIKIRYKQTLFGALWAVFQPLTAMIIFTLFFNRLAGIHTDGPPYPLFAYSGLVLWTFFANSVSMSSNSLVGNQTLVSKVYFPRVFIPVSAIAALLLDLLIGVLLILGLMVYYRWPLTRQFIWIPFFVFGTILAASGCGLLLSAVNVSFRDVKYAVPFFIQMGLFVSPVIYPLSYIPHRFRVILGLNPMSGMIIGFRRALLGGDTDWAIVGASFAICVTLFFSGLFIFRRMERRFADII